VNSNTYLKTGEAAMNAACFAGVLALIIPMAVGVTRLRFDAECLDLLPRDVPAVPGLKLYQQHLPTAPNSSSRARARCRCQETRRANHCERLRLETNLVAEVTWQPPWLEHPSKPRVDCPSLAESAAGGFRPRTRRPPGENHLAVVLSAAREQLATTMSPRPRTTELRSLRSDAAARNVTSAAPQIRSGQEMFASADGAFRIIFVKRRGE